MKRFFLITVIIILIIISGCSTATQETSQPPFDIHSIQSFRDIPGITANEIQAIEVLLAERSSFLYGSVHSTEAFNLPDGVYAGFSALFCDLLSTLFDVPFILSIDDWSEIKNGIDHKTIDFTGDITPTAERMQVYLMTHPIAQRTLGVFSLHDAAGFKVESDINDLTIGIFEETITAQFINEIYPSLRYKVETVQYDYEIIDMLERGVIDAFITDAVHSLSFHEKIRTSQPFSLIYNPVSMTTANPELEPIISAVEKYIIAGGIDVLHSLYHEGEREYAKYEFTNSLTVEEKAYLDNLSVTGAKVPIAYEFENYPICFYNEKENEFQGIAPDILTEITLITGMKFDNITGHNEPWNVTLEKLASGEAAMVSELLYTEERKDRFRWTDIPYAVNRYALISKAEYHYLEYYQVVGTVVGVVRDSSREEVYRKLFPDNENLRYFNHQYELINALNNGTVDLMMATEYDLLTLSNYLEKPGYKVNILFGMPLVESLFGFNEKEDVLCSIICKASLYVNTSRIEREWTTRSFNYEKRMTEEQTHYMNRIILIISIATALLLLVLIILLTLYVRNLRINKIIAHQALTISTMYKTSPDIILSKDIYGRYLSCNSSFEELAGCAEADIIGKTAAEIFAHDHEASKHFISTDHEVIHKKNQVKTEGWFNYPNHARKYFEAIKVPMIKDGEVIGLLSIMRDITEHKKMLEKTKYLSEYELMKYTLASDALKIGLWDMDIVEGDPVNPENKFKWSPAFRQMLGFTDENDFPNILKSWSDRLHPEDKTRTLVAFNAHISDHTGNTPYDLECRLMLKNGEYRFFRAFGNTQRGHMGIPLRVAGALEDITERKQMMQAIEYRDVLMNAVNKAAVFLLDSDEKSFEDDLFLAMKTTGEAANVDRVYIWKNTKINGELYCTQLYEWSEYAEPQQNSMYTVDILYEEVVPGLEKVLSNGGCINGIIRELPPEYQQHLLAQGIVSILLVPLFLHDRFWGFAGFDDCRNERVFVEKEETILRSCGLLFANAYRRNEHLQEIKHRDNLLYAVNRTAEFLLNSDIESFNDVLNQSMKTMLETINADRIYLWKNIEENGQLYATRIFEWSERMKAHQDEPSPTISYRTISSKGEETLSSGTCINGITRDFSPAVQELLTPQGILSIILAPIFINEKFWGIIGIDDCRKERMFTKEEESMLRSGGLLVANAMLRNEMMVDLRDTTEQATVASRAKSDFLSNMSHEIRTPLNAIIGMTTIAKNTADNEYKNHALKKIEESSSHLLGVINDVLDMSKIEANKLELSHVEYFFERMIEKVYTIAQARAMEKQQRFSLTLDHNIPWFVVGDDQHLAQVITNLLSNAVKFTPENGVIELEIILLSEQDKTCELQVTVTDSGIGIAPENNEKIFQPFEQADNQITRTYGGTGLGLVISKKIVELMDGEIRIASEYGKGTQFIFTVKIKRGKKEIRSLLAPNIDWPAIRVLVMDEDVSVRNYFKNLFDHLGINCDTADSIQEAFIAYAEKGAYDVCFYNIAASYNNEKRETNFINRIKNLSHVVLISDAEWKVLSTIANGFNIDKYLEKPMFSSAIIDCINDFFADEIVKQEANESQKDAFMNKKILLVEDYQINREIFISLLKDTGLLIDCAENGAKAVDIIAAEPYKYDLVFMDVHMPVMDGLEATRRIRALPVSNISELPIVALSANVFTDNIAECIAAGMNSHLGKPIDINDLIEMLMKFLGK